MNGTIVLRSHTEVLDKSQKPKRRKQHNVEPKWPACALVFDPETRTDEKQNLTFSPYRIVFADENGQYTNVRQEGFFYDPNELNPHEIDELTNFSKREKAETAPDVSKDLRMLTREEFLKQIFFPLAANGALIVGFNLPFDISRLAADAREARRLNDDWSFVMLDKPFCPRIVVTRKDGVGSRTSCKPINAFEVAQVNATRDTNILSPNSRANSNCFLHHDRLPDRSRA